MKLIKASMPGCQPCAGLSMTLSSIDHPLVENMEELDITKDTQKAIKMRIRSVPTLVLVNEDNNVIRTLNGNQPKDKILEFLA